jgi:uncharacterized protein (TIGR00251 family)
MLDAGGIMKKKIKVMPGAGVNEISDQNGTLLVRVKAPAKGNQANISLIRILSRHYRKKVRIISGFRGKLKTIEIEER